MTDREVMQAVLAAIGAVYTEMTGEPLIVDVSTADGRLRLHCGEARPKRRSAGTSAQASRAVSRAET